ncbi:MAG: hypothetical protein U5M53_03360 [Rhodoferax sp.]|nr:hypothetical protein [Rhodoferax sp.]
MLGAIAGAQRLTHLLPTSSGWTADVAVMSPPWAFSALPGWSPTWATALASIGHAQGARTRQCG